MDHGGASDRITLDVGGTKFVTGASTLTTNSTYFAALLSDNWRPGDKFLDQKPEPFGVLLAYMRSGMIRVDDIVLKCLPWPNFWEWKGCFLLSRFVGIAILGKDLSYLKMEKSLPHLTKCTVAH